MSEEERLKALQEGFRRGRKDGWEDGYRWAMHLLDVPEEYRDSIYALVSKLDLSEFAGLEIAIHRAIREHQEETGS